MLKINWKGCYRAFHTISKLQGSQVKEKLRTFEDRHILVNKSSKELARFNEKRLIKLKKLRKTAYSKQQAAHVLTKAHGISMEGISELEIGPTSQSDLKFLSLTKDRRMLYTILGVNGEQLRDSKLIAEDVKKFLKRGQVEKAVFLTRLAKKKGSAAMNAIMEYYFYDLNYPQSAVKMFNWRKKWGVPPNEYTNTILFKGLAQQKQPVSKATATLVTRVLDGLISREELSQIEYNAALGALANSTDVTPAFELFERRVKGVNRDAITYLWMLRACSRIKTEELFGEVLESLAKNLPSKCLDSRLLFELCKTLSSRPEKKYKQLALAALNAYYDFEVNNELAPKVPEGLSLLPLSHWSVEDKYLISKHTVGLFLQTCLQADALDLGLHVFSTLKSRNEGLIDINIFHIYMEMLIKKDPTTCGQEVHKVFEEMQNMKNIPFSKHSIVLLYLSMEKQASKKIVNNNEEKVNELLGICQAFIKDYESAYSKELKEKVYPIVSWQFLLPIFKRANSNDKVSLIRLKILTDEFMKTLCDGLLDFKNIRKEQQARFIELEFVRLLNAFSEKLRVPDLETVNVSEESPEREAFLLRRLILRLKEKLLQHVELIETGKRESEEVPQLEWSIKQAARMILSSKLP